MRVQHTNPVGSVLQLKESRLRVMTKSKFNIQQELCFIEEVRKNLII